MSESQPLRPRRRWLQFGLRSLMLLTLAVAVAMAWWTRPETLVEVVGGGALRIERQVLRDKEDLIVNHGRWRLFDAADAPQADGAYTRGAAAGNWTLFHADGAEALRGQCREGRREGLWTALHADGSRETEVTYAAGVPQGPAGGWWPDGRLRWQGEYLDGARAGRWSFWDEAGVLREQGEYAAGREQGRWRSWDAEGNELPPRDYVAGRSVPDDAEAVIAQWIARLTGDDGATRAEAAWALAQIGPPAEAALRELYGSPVAARRLAAVEILGGIRPASPETVDALAAALDDAEDSVAMTAAEALGRLGPAAQAALPAIVRLAADSARERSFLRLVLTASASINPRNADAVRRLLLVEPPADASDLFQTGVMPHGGYYYATRPQLAAAMAIAVGDADPAVALAALTALDQMAAVAPREELTDGLLSALADPRRELRRAALRMAARSPAMADQRIAEALEAIAESDSDSLNRSEAENVLELLDHLE